MQKLLSNNNDVKQTKQNRSNLTTLGKTNKQKETQINNNNKYIKKCGRTWGWIKFKRTSLDTKVNKVEPGSKETKNAHL